MFNRIKKFLKRLDHKMGVCSWDYVSERDNTNHNIYLYFCRAEICNKTRVKIHTMFSIDDADLDEQKNIIEKLKRRAAEVKRRRIEYEKNVNDFGGVTVY